MVALIFVLLLWGRKLRTRRPKILKVLSDDETGTFIPDNTNERGKKQIFSASESMPETSPLVTDIPPPIPEDPPGGAVTRIMLLRDDVFFWLERQIDDPHAEVKPCRQIQTKVAERERTI